MTRPGLVLEQLEITLLGRVLNTLKLILQNPLAPRQLQGHSFACSAQLPTRNKPEPAAALSVPGLEVSLCLHICFPNWYLTQTKIKAVELTTCRCLLKPSLQTLCVSIHAACARGRLAAFCSSVFALE